MTGWVGKKKIGPVAMITGHQSRLVVMVLMTVKAGVPGTRRGPSVTMSLFLSHGFVLWMFVMLWSETSRYVSPTSVWSLHPG